MASKESGRDSKEMGKPLLEMRGAIVFKGILRYAGCPFFILHIPLSSVGENVGEPLCGLLNEAATPACRNACLHEAFRRRQALWCAGTESCPYKDDKDACL